MSMCGRFAITESWTEILKYYGIVESNYAFPSKYNIAPSTLIPGIITGTKGERRVGPFRWGLEPRAWNSAGPKPINARSEGLRQNRVFRNLVERRRALIPATGYFEWRKNDKQPFYIRVKSRPIFSFAGFYDTWVNDNGEKVNTCTIITVAPGSNIRLKSIHNRMPAILRGHQDERFWLDRSVTNIDDLLPIIEPFPEDDMIWFPVSKIVGNVINDSPECVQRIDR